MLNSLSLKEIDGVEIISLIDNSVDFNSTNPNKRVFKAREWVTKKRGKKWEKNHFQLPFAEHGFAVLIKIFSKKNHHTILFDTGLSPTGIVTNANRLGIDLTEIECIILSHGHYDHFGGLEKVIKIINKNDLPVIIHEDMFKLRGVINPDNSIREYPKFPSKENIFPAKYLQTKQPFLLFDNNLLVSGEIPRITDFEKGFSGHYENSNGKWVPDPWILDDRAIIINVKDKGLIIISGCAHSGIINTILFGLQITGIEKVHAILGGFHLVGKNGESKIYETIKKLEQFNLEIIVPMHCTGWRGKNAIFKAMPQAFIWNSVGNLYQI